MNITPIGMRLTNSKKRGNNTNKSSYISQTNIYNGDKFELNSKKLSTNTVSFGSSSDDIAKLFEHSGLMKMNDHFHYLKIKQPHLSEKIDKVKAFILELNETAKERGVDLYFDWHKSDRHLDDNFDNMQYEFFKNNAWFTKETYSAFGTANQLHELIHEADLIDQGKRFNDNERYFCELAHERWGTSPNFSIRGCVKERIIGDLKSQSNVKNVGFRFRSFDENMDCISRINSILGDLALDGKL